MTYSHKSLQMTKTLEMHIIVSFLRQMINTGSEDLVVLLLDCDSEIGRRALNAMPNAPVRRPSQDSLKVIVGCVPRSEAIRLLTELSTLRNLSVPGEPKDLARRLNDEIPQNHVWVICLSDDGVQKLRIIITREVRNDADAILKEAEELGI